MVRVITRLLLPVLMAGAACGPSDDGAAAGGQGDSARQTAAPAAGRDTAQVRDAVLRLQEEGSQALMRGDAAFAERNLAEDYVGVTMDGHSETKAQAIANVRRDSATTVDSIRFDSTTVRVHGDAAVSRASGTLRGRSGGQPFTLRFQSTDMFVWRDGRWQIAASHVSRVVGP